MIVVGIPKLREAGWLITGTDRDPVRHLFFRVEQTLDGTGEWTVELSDCRRRADDGGRTQRRYSCETDARTALAAVLTLSRHLPPLPTWDPQLCEPARWRVRSWLPD
ncbi:hypothetical protein GCM10018962_15410 [Dactylosporangium matsuzakiense]|uniref:Uncharacterized protein n=1 Tax=Dactylosporangium matsuzakiense TaxID=53360 RepID=A0A9W6NPR3_9ACTN|nr:hypothetical protein GCM10017581_071270 [Dactylosporangium matsuzakiense]